MWKGAQHLWKHDRGKLVDRLRENAPPHARFEDLLSNYVRAAERMAVEARDVDLDWIRVDTRALAASVQRASLELAAAIASTMRELDFAAVTAERAHMAELREVVQRDPETLQVRRTLRLGLGGSAVRRACML